MDRDAEMLKLSLFAAALLVLPGAQAAESGGLPPVVVYGPQVCLACAEWIEHLRGNGFAATFQGTADMAAVKRRLKVPAEVESVLTATVGKYFIEGHVPAGDIKLLLKEKPKARGLAVPGLPAGAPGFESTEVHCEAGCTVLEYNSLREPIREAYNVLLVAPDGKTSTYARH